MLRWIAVISHNLCFPFDLFYVVVRSVSVLDFMGCYFFGGVADFAGAGAGFGAGAGACAGAVGGGAERLCWVVASQWRLSLRAAAVLIPVAVAARPVFQSLLPQEQCPAFQSLLPQEQCPAFQSLLPQEQCPALHSLLWLQSHGFCARPGRPDASLQSF